MTDRLPSTSISIEYICLVILKQDKNRDIIVAFPDVDPSFISLPHASIQQRYHRNSKPISRRAILKEKTDDSYDHPHLWYSTSEVVRALELFIKSGAELSGSNTYRLVSVGFKSPKRYISCSFVSSSFILLLNHYSYYLYYCPSLFGLHILFFVVKLI